MPFYFQFSVADNGSNSIVNMQYTRARSKKQVFARKGLGKDTIAVSQIVGTLPRIRKSIGTVSYHSFPDVKSTRGKQWINRIRCDPGTAFVVNTRTKICSKRFVLADFISSDLPVEDKR